MIRILPFLFLALSLHAQPRVVLSWDDNREPALKQYEVFNVWYSQRCYFSMHYHTNFDGTVEASFLPSGVAREDWQLLATVTNSTFQHVANRTASFYTVTTSNIVTRLESPKP